MYSQLQPTPSTLLNQIRIKQPPNLTHSRLRGSTITSVNTGSQDSILHTTAMSPHSIFYKPNSQYRFEALALKKPFSPKVPQIHSSYEPLLETRKSQEKHEQILFKLNLYTSLDRTTSARNHFISTQVNAERALAPNQLVFLYPELFPPLSPLMQQQIPEKLNPNAFAIVPYMPPTTWVIPLQPEIAALMPQGSIATSDDIQDEPPLEQIIHYPQIIQRHIKIIAAIETDLQEEQDKQEILAKLSIEMGNIEVENISIRKALKITHTSEKRILSSISEEDVQDIKSVESLHELREISEALNSLFDFCRTLHSRIEDQLQEKVPVSKFEFSALSFQELKTGFEQKLAEFCTAKEQLQVKKDQYLAAGMNPKRELLEERIMLSRQISHTILAVDLARSYAEKGNAKRTFNRIFQSLQCLLGELFFMIPEPRTYVPEANLWKNIATKEKPEIRQQRLRFEGSLSIDLSQNDRVYPEHSQSDEAQTPYKFLGSNCETSRSTLARAALPEEKRARKVCFKMEASEILIDKLEAIAIDDEQASTSATTASSSLRFTENVDNDDEWEDINDDSDDDWEDMTDEDSDEGS